MRRLLAVLAITAAMLTPTTAHATPNCVTRGLINQITTGDTQAHVEQQTFNGYTGSLNQAPHQGDNGAWWFKSKWYDECDHLGHGLQVEYRQPSSDYPTGVWHVKTADYF